MNGSSLPWMTEIGLITWRSVKNGSRPPLPSEVAATFIVFGAISVLGNSQPKVASALGWGFVLATFLNFWDTTSGRPRTGPAQPQAAAPPQPITRYGPN